MQHCQGRKTPLGCQLSGILIYTKWCAAHLGFLGARFLGTLLLRVVRVTSSLDRVLRKGVESTPWMQRERAIRDF